MVATLTDTPFEIPRQAARPAAETAAAKPAREHRGLFGPEGFSFGALLDIINPLQHIPVVNTIYRAVTGDKIENGSRLIGGALFGGPIGFLVSAVSGMIQESTGKDIGDHMLAAAGLDFGGGTVAPPGTALVEKTPGAAVDDSAVLAHDPEVLQPDLAQMVALASPNAVPLPPAAQAAASQPERISAGNRPVVVPVGAISDLVQRAWNTESPVARSAQAASTTSAPATSTSPAMPDQITVQSAASADRKWFPAFPAQGGVVTRGVGADPVGPQNAALKSGVVRGAPAMGAAQSPSEIAERANSAYQKYLDLKKQQGRNPAPKLDQSF